jgi:hypothetical protein
MGYIPTYPSPLAAARVLLVVLGTTFSWVSSIIFSDDQFSTRRIKQIPRRAR